MYSVKSDFRYSGFWISRYNLQNYVKAVKKSQGLMGSRYDDYTFGIVTSIIASIATNDVQFNTKDPHMCRLLEELIRVGGRDRHGVYSERAHQAIRNLYMLQGKNPDDAVLYDKNITSTFNRVKNKVKSLFGFKKQENRAPQPAPAPAPKPKPATPPMPAPQPAPAHKPVSKPAPARPNKNKILYRVTATLTGLVAVGAAIFMTSDVTMSTMESDVTGGRTPTFKTISVGDTTHKTTHVYNLAEQSRQKITQRQMAATRPASQKQAINHAPQKQDVISVRPSASASVATDSVSVRLTQASQSALNILLGQKKADELCRRVQAQIDAGIFAAPRGMSVQRIAHAMTMSRIYEGKSVILDALKSTERLTPAQQAAFEHHIAEIGDLGVKLQQRMAKGHRMSNHSRFNHASKAMQKAHVNNLKQLKQLRKMAQHVR